MTDPERLPLVGAAFRFGAGDRVLDSLLVLGPVVILAFVLLGRTPFTTAFVGCYILAFLGDVIYNGIR